MVVINRPSKIDTIDRNREWYGYIRDQKFIYLTYLCSSEKGTGSKLLNTVCKYSKYDNEDVYLMSKEPLWGYYHKLGFQRINDKGLMRRGIGNIIL